MSRMTNVDREFSNAVSRFIREYNIEINYLKAELEKERMKSARLEAKLRLIKEKKDGQVL